MALLGGTRQAAEHFAALLDGTAVAGADPALRALAGLAGQLSALPLAPAPAFRAALRDSLVSAAAHQGALVSAAGAGAALSAPTAAGTTATVTSLVGKAGLAGLSPWVSGAAASVIAVAGAGLAAHASLPGDPFYGVKRAVQHAQYDLASTHAARTATQLGFARSRLQEVTDLAGRSPAPASRLVDALRGWREAAGPATAGLLDEVRSGRPQAATQLREFTASQIAGLTQLLAALPPDARARAEQGITLMTSAQAALQRLQAAGSPLSGPPAAPGQNAPGPAGTLPGGGPGGTGPSLTGPATTPPGATTPGATTPGATVPNPGAPSGVPVPRPSGGTVLPTLPPVTTPGTVVSPGTTPVPIPGVSGIPLPGVPLPGGPLSPLPVHLPVPPVL